MKTGTYFRKPPNIRNIVSGKPHEFDDGTSAKLLEEKAHLHVAPTVARVTAKFGPDSKK